MNTKRLNAVRASALAIVGLLSIGAASAQSLTYIALGDSAAVGYQSTSLNGYVGRYAEWLSGVDGSTVNYQDLGVNGETSTSILGAQLTNFHNTVASDKSAGDTITTISVQIGGNDFLNYVEGQLPTVAQFDQGFPAILQTVQTNYTTLLTDIRSKVPNCDLILNGYWELTAFGSTIQTESDIANADFASMATTLATQYDGGYIDNYDPFLGNNATFMSTDGIHPNDAGYTQIAVDMEPVVVPAPSALVTAALGFGLLLVGVSVATRK